MPSSARVLVPLLALLVALAAFLLWQSSTPTSLEDSSPVAAGVSTTDLLTADAAGATADALAAPDADAAQRAMVTEAARLPTGVRGRIVDEKTRQPLAGVEVLAMRRPPGFERLLSRFRSAFFEGQGLWAESVPAPEILGRATTDGAGRFEMLDLPDGILFLDGRADFTFVRSPRQLRLAHGEVREDVELVGSAAGRIRGIVFDPDGTPASGVAVNVRPGLNAFLGQMTERQYRWLESMTDANGEFDIPGVPAGHGYTLSAAGPLIALAEEHGIDVTEGQVTRVEVRGLAGATIAGRVLDVDGTPMPGANVAMVYLDMSRVLFSADGRTEPITTDDRGMFRMERVASGRIAFIAAADGRAPSAIDELAVVDRGVYEDLELILNGGERLSGLVVDQEGRPLSRALVEVRPLERPDGPDVLKTLLKIREIEVQTGEDGRFDADGISARRLFVQASKPGYVTSVQFGYDMEDGGDLRIELQRGVTVRGRVVDSTGAPITRFRVDTRSRQPRTESTQGETAEAGAADGADADDEDRPRFGPPGGRGERGGFGRNRTMQLAEGQRMGEQGFGGSWRDFQAADGKFEISGVPPGSVRVRVRAEGFRDPDNQTVELAAGESSDELEFALTVGAIARGRVVDAEGGAPVADAQVTAYRSRDGERGGMFRINFDPQDVDFMGMAGGNSVMTDSQGEFRIVGLTDGDYRFTARHPDRAKASVKDVTIAAANASEDILIEIESGGAIEGRVTGRGELPVADALVVAFSVAAGSFKSGSTDQQGLYRIDGLPSGQYVVFKSRIGERAMNIGYDLLGNMRLKSITVRKNEVTEFDIHDETASSVRVFGVVRDGGEPVVRGMVTALTADGDGLFGMGIRAQPTDENGRYELIGLEPGEYFFQVSRFEGRPQQANLSIEIPAGAREMRVDLDLPQSSIAGRVLDSTGQPIAGIVVSAGVEEGGIEDAPGLLGLILKNGVAQDRTDAEGRYKLDKMAAGVYRISAGNQRGRRALRKYGEASISEVNVDGVVPVENVDLILPFAGKLTGLVLDGSGQPLAGAEVHYSRQDLAKRSEPTDQLMDLMGIQARPARTGDDGRFEIEGVTPGIYRVRADADGLAPGVADDVVVAPEATVDVRLTVVRGATVKVRGRNIDGSMIPFASISVIDGQGKPLASKVSVMSVFQRMMGRNEKKPDTGWYEVGNIPPDTYTVIITEKDQPEVRVTRTVRDGEVLEWDIDVAAELEASGRARGQAK